MDNALISHLSSLINIALAEDIGSGDITSQLLIPADAQASMQFVAREKLVLCGAEVPGLVYQQVTSHQSPVVNQRLKDGVLARKGDIIATVTGNARTLLAGERVALNILQRMSGVATLTRQYVDAVAGTKAVILDTRKTMPGMRLVDKYAVRTGGGQNHRMGLYDAVLVKDNHLAGERGGGRGYGEIINNLRNKLETLPSTLYPLPSLIIECDTLAQVEEALAAKPDRILLDNMSLENLRAAVKLVCGKIPLEASGGVNLNTVRAIAETGVDYISVGAITHSAPAVDIGLDVTAQ